MNKPWYKNTYILAYIAIFTLIVLGTTTFLVLRNQATNSKPNNESSSSVSDIVRSPIASSDSKTLALQRLSQITGGVGLDELQKLQNTTTPQKNNTNSTLTAQNTLNTKAASDQSLSISSPVGLTSEYAEQLIQEKNINDDLVIYSETESFYSPLEGQNVISRFGDEKNPLKTKTWYSTNYYKSINYLGNDIVNMYINTPKSSLTYYGGKYAIRDSYISNSYFGGVLYNTNGVQNQELAFLKQILQNPNLKKLSPVQKDGRKLDVYEDRQANIIYSSDNSSEISNIQSSSSSSTVSSTLDNSGSSLAPNLDYYTRYYVDQANFVLYLVENYSGGKLQYSNKTLKSQEIKSPNLADLFDVKEIGQTPIKEFKTQDYYTKSSSLENFSQKYGILISKDIGTKNIYVNDLNIPEIVEYEKARNTTDFDPSYLDYTKQVGEAYQAPAATIYQQKGNESLNINFYNSVPNDAQPDLFSGYDKVRKTIKVNLNGKMVESQYLGVSLNGQDYNATATFKYNNYWVVVSAYQSYISVPLDNSSSSSQAQISNTSLEKTLTNYTYTTLPVTSAKEIDSFRNEKIKSTPAIEPINLDNLEPSRRLLPGNLEPEYKLNLSSVIKSSRKSTQSTCYNYLEYFYEVESCLLEKYDGYQLNYTNTATTYAETTSSDLSILNSYTNLSLSFLNTPIKEIKIDELKSKIKDDYTNYEIVPFQDGYKIGVAGDFYSQSYIIPFKNQTILVNYYKPNVDMNKDRNDYDLINKIITNVSVDKDLDTLKKQLESVSSFGPVKAL